MSSSFKEFQHLKFSLEDIKSATNDFADCIGQGGFGKVYKGELLISTRLTLVAVKRLNNALGQGVPEFWREIMLLTRYKHENLVSLLGFCDEGGENILVYEYLSKKSLDLYLSNADLSWTQRLRICIGAARGLQYLHEPAEGSQQRVLHRDIKSANILLDENWKAKISDFGLSKFGPANQQFTFLFSNAVGTMGYCDPLYMQTGFLTKESDIYSFGVVLFEVLCGRHCVQISYEDIRRFLPVLARKCYDEKKIDSIVDKSLKDQISSECLERFSKIAYQCLRMERTERPLVTEIVKELEIALQYQMEFEFEKENRQVEFDSEEYWETKLPRDWKIITRIFNIPSEIYTIRKKLFYHLSDGILYDEGKKFFWINNDGKKCEMISATRFLEPHGNRTRFLFQREHLRFSRVADILSTTRSISHNLRCQLKTSMLSLGTMYAASLVFKFDPKPNTPLEQVELITIKWKMEELRVGSIHYAKLTPDNWYKITMWHFINHGTNADFDIVLEQLSIDTDSFESYLPGFMIQGIEFQPIEMQDDVEGFESLSITNEENIDEEDIDANIDEEDIDADDEYWVKKLPDNYRHYIIMSDKRLDPATKKESYHHFREGFLGEHSHSWFSLHKSTRGLCSMKSATDILFDNPSELPPETLYLPESRFGKAIKLGESEWFTIKYRLPLTQILPRGYYACYLVFKFEDNYNQPFDISLFKTEYSSFRLDIGTFSCFSCLCMNTVNIPTIKPKNDYVWHDDSSSSIPRVEEYRMPKGYKENPRKINCIKERKDGWLEVMLLNWFEYEWEEWIELKLSKDAGVFPRMIIEGIDFRHLSYCW